MGIGPVSNTIGQNWPVVHIPIFYSVAVVMLALPQMTFALIGGFLFRKFKISEHSKLIGCIRGLFQFSVPLLQPMVLEPRPSRGCRRGRGLWKCGRRESWFCRSCRGILRRKLGVALVGQRLELPIELQSLLQRVAQCAGLSWLGKLRIEFRGHRLKLGVVSGVQQKEAAIVSATTATRRQSVDSGNRSFIGQSPPDTRRLALWHQTARLRCRYPPMIINCPLEISNPHPGADHARADCPAVDGSSSPSP